jgi:hypothetical protein
MPRRESWRRVIGRLLSPLFHLTLLKQRLASNLGSGAGWAHRLLSLCYLSTVLAVAVAIPGGWLVLLTAVVAPLGLLYNVISTLRLCTEHRFTAAALGGCHGPESLASTTSAIFLGDPAPPQGPAGARLVAWAVWWGRLLLWHLPARLLVLPGDSGPAHDLHTRHPKLKDWPNYLFARQRAVEANLAVNGPPYTETWGSVFTAIDEVFLSLERLAPTDYPARGQAA